MSELLTLAELLRKHRECGPLAAINFEKNDIAVVAGAYEGATMKFLLEMYSCTVLGFEPQQVHRERAEAAMDKGYDGRWMIFPYGLGVKDGFFPMGEVGTDAASFVPDSAARTQGEGELRDAALVMHDVPIKLLVLNIEGYEYELLVYLESKGILRNIENIVVQFHDVEPTRHQTDYIHTTILMERTHRCRWVHPNEPSWTWQWWERMGWSKDQSRD